MADDFELFKRRFEREKKIRIQAELLLEKKAAELYEVNQELVAFNKNLEKQVFERTKEINQEYARLSTLIDSLNGGILLENKARNIVLVNSNFCSIFKIPLTPEECIGIKSSQLIDNVRSLLLNPASFEKYIKKIIDWQRPIFNVKLKLKNGIVLEGDYIPIFSDGEYNGHMWHYRDITKQQLFQKELIMAREAEKNFLANMSHEIRTPLNSAIGLTQLLKLTTLNTKQNYYVDGIITSSQHLLKMLDHILDFSKIKSHKMVIEETDFDLKDLIEKLISSISYKAEEKSISLTYNFDEEINPIIKSDSVKLKQVIVNLFGNSLKFTQAGQIKITCQLIKKYENSQKIKFEVRDTGIGIKKENLSKIFKSFTQEEDSITRKYGGTGLGLTISKEIVELLGGTLEVESIVDLGSKFYFTLNLPNGNNDSTKSLEIVIDPEVLRGKNILVAEDYAPNRFIVQSFLENWNVNVILAENGKEAVELAESNKIDLILMDIQMPIMNGIIATKHIRKNNTTTPIIGLSATVVKEIINSGYKSGMNDYISKPFEPLTLYKKIVENLGLNKSAVYLKNELETPSLPPNVISENQIEVKTELIYNLKPLLNMVNNDMNKVSQMATIFIENTSIDLEIVKKALSEKDGKQLAMVFHKLKGSVSLLNINNLVNLLSQGEALAKSEGNFNELEKITNEISDTLSIAISQLKVDKTFSEYKS